MKVPLVYLGTLFSSTYFLASLAGFSVVLLLSKVPLGPRSFSRWWWGTNEPVWVSLHWNIWWMSTFSLAARGGEREMERENKHKATHVWSLITPGAGANCLPSFTPSPMNTLTNNITAPHSNLYVCTCSCLMLTSDPLNVGRGGGV